MASLESDDGNIKSDVASQKFTCSASDCNQIFMSKDRLLVHEQKHQMTLKLGVKSANYLSEALTVDQTPTPTRFLQYGNQVGLFDELSNPFDRDFKAAQKEGSSKQRRPTQFTVGSSSKVRTPTSPNKPSFSSESFPLQPMHVITLTPSPVAALPTNQFFVPPSLIPSPQAMPVLPSLPGFSGTSSPLSMPPNHLLSPTLMQYPGLISVMSDSQRAAAAIFAANVSASSPSVATMSHPFLSANSNLNSVQSNTDSKDLPSSSRSNETLQNSSNPTDDCLMSSSSPVNKGGKPTLSTAVSSNNLSLNISTSNSLKNSTLNEIQSNINKNNCVEKFPNNSCIVDAKQKLKETLKINNPGLLQNNLKDVQLATTDLCMTSSIASNTTSTLAPRNDLPSHEQLPATTGRRRGRQSRDIDPDVKRQRFLERNRAAASRCRNKKKKWVHGLEQKAKTLSQTNILLQNEITSLKDEVASLKQLLLSHRDCPVTKMQQQSMSVAGMKFDMLSQANEQAASSISNAIKMEVNSNKDSSLKSQLSLSRVSSISSLSNPSTIFEVPKSTNQLQTMQQPQLQHDQMIFSPPDSNTLTPMYANRACS